jgi:hypothetical protein
MGQLPGHKRGHHYIGVTILRICTCARRDPTLSARGMLSVVVHAVRFEQKRVVGLACEKTTLGPVLSLGSGILRRMEDQRDPHYTPFGKAPAARTLDPRESLWTCGKITSRGRVSWSFAARVTRGNVACCAMEN